MRNIESCFCNILLVLSFLCVFAPPGASGFEIPEKLVYELKWSGIKAGTATLKIVDKKDSIKIISTARSADWVSFFYPVEDRIVSTVAKNPARPYLGLPLRYRVKIREGRHRRDKEVIFDHGNHNATFIDHLDDDKKNVEILADTFDPLSSFYYVRTLKLEVGKPVFVNIFDSRKMWNVEVQILRKERITTKLGTFDTVLIKPLMKSEGVFNRKGAMYIWLTDDDKHVPVKLRTKVAIGHVTATLVRGRY